jgi:hypothetical protein
MEEKYVVSNLDNAFPKITKKVPTEGFENFAGALDYAFETWSAAKDFIIEDRERRLQDAVGAVSKYSNWLEAATWMTPPEEKEPRTTGS